MIAALFSARLRPIAVLVALCLLLTGMLALAKAESWATGAAIKSAISGNTFRGSLEGSGRFEEFYAPNGVIQGPDYRGEWSIRGDRLCLAYDGDPASCWGIKLEGGRLIWMGAQGAEGSGEILRGNPNGF